MSISSEISRLTQAKADIKTAIENKGVTVPGSAKLDDYPDYIDDIEQGGGGGGGASDDVRFVDYDGTVLHTYSADEFLSLTAMPENPTHEGLTSQGWNWSLADAKEYVQTYGMCDIGQMYITNDGATRLYVTIPEGRQHPSVGVSPNGQVEIDWGDGSPTSLLTGTSTNTLKSASHEYTSAGDYVITLTPVSGTFKITGSSGYLSIFKKYNSSDSNQNKVYTNCIKKVFFGTGVIIGGYALYACNNLSIVTLPREIDNIGEKAFASTACKCFVIPHGVLSVYSNAFYSNTSLKIVSLPKSATNIASYAFGYSPFMERVCFPDWITTISGYMFVGCNGLEKVIIPNSVTKFENNVFQNCYAISFEDAFQNIESVGTSVFSGCYKLESVTIPSSILSLSNNLFSECKALFNVTIQNGVESIGSGSFLNCVSLSEIIIPDSVTKIGTTAFSGCSHLYKVVLPVGISEIPYQAFKNCVTLSEINIPSNVVTIGQQAMYSCRSLSKITIPSGVSNIGNEAFSYCTGMAEYHFLSETPPTLGGSGVFTSIPSDCIIYVPAGSLEAYKSAQYWSSHASKMVGE